MPIPKHQRNDHIPGTVTGQQIKAIHIAKRQIDLDDETYRGPQWLGQFLRHPQYQKWLAEHGGEYSSKALSRIDARQLLSKMTAHGARISKPYTRRQMNQSQRRNKSSNVVELASAAELALINRLKDEITWRRKDGYQRWLRTYYKIDQVRTSEQAAKVIEGLKGLKRHE